VTIFQAIIAIYQVFALNKMKAHIKEYDRLVTIRYEDMLDATAKVDIKKKGRREDRKTKLISKKIFSNKQGTEQNMHSPMNVMGIGKRDSSYMKQWT